MKFWNRTKNDRRCVIGCQEWGQRREMIAKEHKGTFWGDGNVLYPDCNDSCMTAVFVETDQTILKPGAFYYM